MDEYLTRDTVVTPQEAYQRFLADGESIAAWAVKNGFNPSLVYLVLLGKRKCLRGQSHKIAIRLGIKARHRLSAAETSHSTAQRNQINDNLLGEPSKSEGSVNAQELHPGQTERGGASE